MTYGTPATAAAKRATTTIPIVMISIGDPARVGLVARLAHPGGNVTGNSNQGPELAAKRLKVTTTLDPTALLDIPVPEGQPRVTLRVRLPNRTLTADIAAKSLRKAQTAVRDAGAGSVSLVLQGHLDGDTIAEAGLSSQPRAARSP